MISRHLWLSHFSCVRTENMNLNLDLWAVCVSARHLTLRSYCHFKSCFWQKQNKTQPVSDNTSIFFKKGTRKVVLLCLFQLNYSVLLREMQLEGVIPTAVVWGRCLIGIMPSKNPFKHFHQSCWLLLDVWLWYVICKTQCERKTGVWFSFFGCTESN